MEAEQTFQFSLVGRKVSQSHQDYKVIESKVDIHLTFCTNFGFDNLLIKKMVMQARSFKICIYKI